MERDCEVEVGHDQVNTIGLYCFEQMDWTLVLVLRMQPDSRTLFLVGQDA